MRIFVNFLIVCFFCNRALCSEALQFVNDGIRELRPRTVIEKIQDLIPEKKDRSPEAFDKVCEVFNAFNENLKLGKIDLVDKSAGEAFSKILYHWFKFFDSGKKSQAQVKKISDLIYTKKERFKLSGALSDLIFESESAVDQAHFSSYLGYMGCLCMALANQYGDYESAKYFLSRIRSRAVDRQGQEKPDKILQNKFFDKMLSRFRLDHLQGARKGVHIKGLIDLSIAIDAPDDQQKILEKRDFEQGIKCGSFILRDHPEIALEILDHSLPNFADALFSKSIEHAVIKCFVLMERLVDYECLAIERLYPHKVIFKQMGLRRKYKNKSYEDLCLNLADAMHHYVSIKHDYRIDHSFMLLREVRFVFNVNPVKCANRFFFKSHDYIRKKPIDGLFPYDLLMNEFREHHPEFYENLVNFLSNDLDQDHPLMPKHLLKQRRMIVDLHVNTYYRDDWFEYEYLFYQDKEDRIAKSLLNGAGDERILAFDDTIAPQMFICINALAVNEPGINQELMIDDLAGRYATYNKQPLSPFFVWHALRSLGDALEGFMQQRLQKRLTEKKQDAPVLKLQGHFYQSLINIYQGKSFDLPEYIEESLEEEIFLKTLLKNFNRLAYLSLNPRFIVQLPVVADS